MTQNVPITNDENRLSPKDLFNEILSRATNLFKNKQALQSDYMPSEILFRNKEIIQLTKALSPVLMGTNPVNIFIFGFSGTGKT
ncbi:MAG: hypothetical protein QXF82_10600, partial [Nitrososphaeria archaeon]